MSSDRAGQQLRQPIYTYCEPCNAHQTFGPGTVSADGTAEVRPGQDCDHTLTTSTYVWTTPGEATTYLESGG